MDAGNGQQLQAQSSTEQHRASAPSSRSGSRCGRGSASGSWSSGFGTTGTGSGSDPAGPASEQRVPTLRGKRRSSIRCPLVHSPRSRAASFSPARLPPARQCTSHTALHAASSCAVISGLRDIRRACSAWSSLSKSEPTPRTKGATHLHHDLVQLPPTQHWHVAAPQKCGGRREEPPVGLLLPRLWLRRLH